MKLPKLLTTIFFVSDLLVIGILPAAASYGSWDATYNGYGDTNYTPVPADYDGDKKADLSAWGNTGAWYIDYSGNGYGGWDATYNGYGDPNYTPVPADYDGDAKADLSVWGNTGAWYIDYFAL